MARASRRSADDATLPAVLNEPKLEQITLPPPAGESTSEPATKNDPADATLKKPVVVPSRDDPADAPPPAVVRPREVEPQKKKGKKGSDEP